MSSIADELDGFEDLRDEDKERMKKAVEIGDLEEDEKTEDVKKKEGAHTEETGDEPAEGTEGHKQDHEEAPKAAEKPK
jgi:hypothetical protein